jgi:DNA-binding transcriptional MocR family regulator
MLSTLTTNEISERVVHKILSEGHYRKHVDRIRVRLDAARNEATARVEKLGMKVEYRTPAGMFLWVETGCDTINLTEKALEKGILLAPGSLFSPHQLPSTHMRINVAAMSDSSVWDFFEKELK